MVAAALAAGSLTRQACERCGRGPTHAHHPRGYAPDHALDIQWLCASCHGYVHPRVGAMAYAKEDATA